MGIEEYVLPNNVREFGKNVFRAMEADLKIDPMKQSMGRTWEEVKTALLKAYVEGIKEERIRARKIKRKPTCPRCGQVFSTD